MTHALWNEVLNNIMSLYPPWITAGIEVSDIDAAIKIYVEKWRLFRVEYRHNDSAALRLIDTPTPFLLTINLAGRTDTQGWIIPSAKTGYLVLPINNFWQWVDTIFGSRDIIEQTPWSCYVVLTDPFGHMFVFETNESPPEALR